MASSSRLESQIPKKQRGIWLIDGILDKISGCKLPSNRQVLGRLFHLNSKEKKTVQVSTATTANEVMLYWEKARIPTRQRYHIVNKIKELHNKWRGLKKNSSRTTEKQKTAEKFFVGMLNDLFDIAHADAMSLIKIDEDRQFLEAQHEKGRRGSMGSIDTKLAKKEERNR